jgi:GDPmannose 4,6-dehydratase
VSTALVIGAGGQDGRILAEKLTWEGHRVVGIRRGAVELTDAAAVRAMIGSARPDRIYYLAAYHHSSEDRALQESELFRASFAVHVDGLVNVLEAMRAEAAAARLFYAASSHVFGQAATPVQDETTPMNPDNVYGITKTAGVHCCRFFRNEHGVFAAVGFLYNHESRHRRKDFVSTKIVRAAVEISRGRKGPLVLGDLSARIDWGYAPDYVDAMARILELDRADEFVVATGEPHSVAEFAEIAFAAVGLDWRKHVVEDAGIITKRRLGLVGNPAKLKGATGWAPTVTFGDMVRKLVQHAGTAV